MKTIGRPFQKGVSGNPGGRPRSLAPYIRETTSNGEELVDLMVQVMRGESINGMKPRIKDQIDAATWLSDRGFGKPVTQIEATSRSMNVDMTLSEMSSDKLTALLQASTEQTNFHRPLTSQLTVSESQIDIEKAVQLGY